MTWWNDITVSKWLPYIGSSVLAVGWIWIKIRRHTIRLMSSNDIVLITGCDSGLGYNLALYCHSLNMTVVSGCLSSSSEGAKKLQSTCDPNRMIVVELDVTDENSISAANSLVKKLLSENSKNNFSALINNAGIMCFGEFEWQTPGLVESQIQVNLLGTMRVTKEFLPLIRRQNGSRIINVTSHCSEEALPGLAPYAATKAGLRFWNDALRMEMGKYGVKVINFVPGSFVMSSNITANQHVNAEEMKKAFTIEQKDFYGEYFERYNQYLALISGYKGANTMDDCALFQKFRYALCAKYPDHIYKHEPFRYFIYHMLFRLSPTIAIKERLIKKFINLPEYILTQEINGSHK